MVDSHFQSSFSKNLDAVAHISSCLAMQDSTMMANYENNIAGLPLGPILLYYVYMVKYILFTEL